MNIRDFKRLGFGEYILTDGISNYKASVYPSSCGRDKGVNIYKNGYPDKGYISLIEVINNPVICATIGSINVYSDDVNYAIQFLELVGRWGNYEENVDLYRRHKVNMRINRKLKK